jgi:hypothetical protein
MSMGEGLRRVRERREVDGCARMRKRRLLFIGARGARGGARKSTMAATIGTAKGQGDVRVSFLVSRRFWGA